jgi:hypothetical protein
VCRVAEEAAQAKSAFEHRLFSNVHRKSGLTVGPKVGGVDSLPPGPLMGRPPR